VGHIALDIDGAAHGVDDADELHQHTVARGLDDAAAVLGDLGVDEFLTMGLELAQRAFLVDAHQPAIAGDIGRENGRQPPFYPRLGHENRALCFHHHATGLTWPITITHKADTSGTRKKLCFTLILACRRHWLPMIERRLRRIVVLGANRRGERVPPILKLICPTRPHCNGQKATTSFIVACELRVFHSAGVRCMSESVG
jgi:hypothetical protein